MRFDSADAAWSEAYQDATLDGREVAPRGKLVRESDHRTVYVNMRYPVVRARPGLSYPGLAAEALWIIDGRDDVEYLAGFLPRYREFSDDGRTLAGAYGPRIACQLKYVLAKLVEDRDTRQAVLSIWTPNPMPSKDIPCTMSMVFMIRNDKLEAHVFMRSSDVWLGLPYDIFSFAMVAEWVRLFHNTIVGTTVATGGLFITAASSHVYEKYWGMKTANIISDPAPMPEWQSLEELRSALVAITESKRGDPARWWET